MKRVALPLLLLAMVACQEAVTSPGSALAPSAPSRLAFGGGTLPPPPPFDTGVVTSTSAGSATFSATFFINRTGNNAFLRFKSDQPAGASASPNAQVFYRDGTFGGRGTLSFSPTDGETVTVDLASVSQDSYFTSCEKGCFNLSFSDATLTNSDGTTTLPGGVHIAPLPALDDTRW